MTRRRRLVVIHGFAGTGKTALAREAADWLTRTEMYVTACTVSFERVGDAATWLLSEVGRHLGAYDGGYDPGDVRAALATLRPVLKQYPTLIIADNLESMLPGVEALLPSEARRKLWSTLLALRDAGFGVILTTRDINVGDKRMASAERAWFLDLGGLHPDDAYSLASQVLEALRIDRADIDYAELRALLFQLDYNPLAIQLVLPRLSDVSLQRIRDEFASLLPKFADDTVTGRNHSLLASIEYSLQRLSDEQRSLLSSLAPFEGGANEKDLLDIIEIPLAVWKDVRGALEQTGLIRAEPIHEALDAPFLRLHPVLAPFLRRQPEANDQALWTRYVWCYRAIAGYLQFEDYHDPELVRALVRRELPNMRHVLDLLTMAEDFAAATMLADQIAHFLTIFGLEREREAMWQHLTQVITAAEHDSSEKVATIDYTYESGLGEHEFLKGDLRAAETRFRRLLAWIETLPADAPQGIGSHDHCTTLARLARCLRMSGQLNEAEQLLRNALSFTEKRIAQAHAARENNERSEYGVRAHDGMPHIRDRYQRKNIQPPEQIEGKSRVQDQGRKRVEQSATRQRGMLLNELGDVLRDLGRYQRSKTAYEESLKIQEALEDTRGQGVVLAQLGRLALAQRDYALATERYTQSLALSRQLNEPVSEAITWHQLGLIAQDQHDFATAERCFRASLIIEEQLGDFVHAAATCNQLGIVTERAGRLVEAEGWYRRALALDEQAQPDGEQHLSHLINLARILLEGIKVGRAQSDQLAEIRTLAERALRITAQLNDPATEPWYTYALAAAVAELDSRDDDVKMYRRYARETFALFDGNRFHVDQDFGWLINGIVKAVQGDIQMLANVQTVFPAMEAVGETDLSSAIRRILKGERDWHTLAEELSPEHALMVRRVLETLEDQAQAPGDALPTHMRTLLTEAEDALSHRDKVGIQNAYRAMFPGAPPQILAQLADSVVEATNRQNSIGLQQMLISLLPDVSQELLTAIREGIERQDVAAIHRALTEALLPEALLSESQQLSSDPSQLSELDALALSVSDPLLHGIAAVARGDEALRASVEAALTQLDINSRQFRDVVKRIWAGEREAAKLTVGLEALDIAMVYRVLELVKYDYSPVGLDDASVPSVSQLITSLPVAIREALAQNDNHAFMQAFEVLSSEDQQAVAVTLQHLRLHSQPVEFTQNNVPSPDAILKHFAPLLEEIVEIAQGNQQKRADVERVLADLETKGWHLSHAVYRIWSGERNSSNLFVGLDLQDTILVQRVLELLD